MARSGFGTAINCIDGRVQLPVIGWIRGVLALEYVDLVTELGILA
jgi:Putative carbonic anhydrase